MKRGITPLITIIILTIIFGTIYVTVQQVLRQTANDPQIQLAEDAALQLDAGAQPAALTVGKVDMANSLAPFTIIYDVSSGIVAGSGYLDQRIPVIPRGVLTSVGTKPYTAVTWQPRPGVRIAAVVTRAGTRYVLSGRSLLEVEKREDAFLAVIGTGWFASVLGVGLTVALKRIRK